MCPKYSKKPHTPVQYLQHLLCFLGSLIVSSTPLQVILVLLAVHVLVNGLTQEAVLLLADGAVEVIHLVLVEAEPLAVVGTTVEAVGSCTLGLPESSLVQLLKLLLRDNLAVG